MKLTVEGLEKERDFYFGQWLSLRYFVTNYHVKLNSKLKFVFLGKKSRHMTSFVQAS